GGCMIGFGLIFALVGCGTLVGPLVGYIPTLLSGGGLPSTAVLVGMGGTLLFSLPFMGVGILIMVLGIRPFLARAKVSKPEVALSNTSPAVGEPVTFSYRQTFKSAADAKRLQFQLVLRESATYRRGTDTVTVHHEHIVQEYEEPPRRFQGGESLTQQRQFQVPRQGMHTFSANRNKLDWFIRARVELTGWPDFIEEYPLVVQPRLAA
ncbi:MAG: hypothetical protein ABI847_19275, partial [Anaerolineales bacterium]